VKSPGGVTASPPASPRAGGACDCVGAGGAGGTPLPPPGASFVPGAIPTALAELDLDYGRRYGDVRIPEAYERCVSLFASFLLCRAPSLLTHRCTPHTA
jgi:hypothetical protein